MSAESYGRRWAGEPVKPVQEYFDRLMSVLEAEAPLDESASSLRYDELACMRRALAVAATARRPFTADHHPTRSFSLDGSRSSSSSTGPMEVQKIPSTAGRCSAAVAAILGPAGVLKSEYAINKKTQQQQPTPSREQDLDALLAPRGRAELALRRRGMWSDAGERAACDLLGKWNGEFKRLSSSCSSNSDAAAGVDVAAYAPGGGGGGGGGAAAAEHRRAQPKPSSPPRRTSQERKGEAGWREAWRDDSARGATTTATAPPPPSYTLPPHAMEAAPPRSRRAPLGNNASAYTCAGPARFSAGGQSLMPAAAAAAAAAGGGGVGGSAALSDRLRDVAAAREAKAQPNFVQRGAAGAGAGAGGGDAAAAGVASPRKKGSAAVSSSSPTRSQQQQLELEQWRKRREQQQAKQQQQPSASPSRGKDSRRRRWFKPVAVVMTRRGGRESHKFVDIVNGVSEFHFGRTTHRYDGSLLVGPIVPAHGFEVAESVHAALSATYPADARHLHAPRALLEVMVGGGSQMVDGRIFFMTLTPVRLLADPARYAALHRELFGDEFYLPAPPLTDFDPRDEEAEDDDEAERIAAEEAEAAAEAAAEAERRAALEKKAAAALASVGATPGIESTPLGVSAALAVAARALARGTSVDEDAPEADDPAQQPDPDAAEPPVDVSSEAEAHEAEAEEAALAVKGEAEAEASPPSPREEEEDSAVPETL